MSWNDGDNKGNPWKSNGKGPSDLDAIVRDLQRKLAGFFSRRGGTGRSGGGLPVSAGVIAAIVAVVLGLWLFTGFYTVDAAERGLVLRFGAYQATTMPGLRWHWPWPIERVEKINVGATERFVYEGGMLTGDENIVIVNVVVQYRRSDPEAFLFNLRDPERTLTDATASAIREVVGRNLLDFILTEGRAEVAAQAHALLQNTLDTYGTGITVTELNLQEANFPPQVEDAVQDAIMAREDRERRILEAQAIRNEILPRARGAAARQLEEAEAYRARVVADAEGEADRFLRIMTEYQKAPRVTRERLYIETLEEILANSTKVLLDSSSGGGNNLIYLPLDQLLQQRRSGRDGELPSLAPAPQAGSPTNARTPARERNIR